MLKAWSHLFILDRLDQSKQSLQILKAQSHTSSAKNEEFLAMRCDSLAVR